MVLMRSTVFAIVPRLRSRQQVVVVARFAAASCAEREYFRRHGQKYLKEAIERCRAAMRHLMNAETLAAKTW
jgi:hypothetical protein